MGRVLIILMLLGSPAVPHAGHFESQREKGRSGCCCGCTGACPCGCQAVAPNGGETPPESERDREICSCNDVPWTIPGFPVSQRHSLDLASELPCVARVINTSPGHSPAVAARSHGPPMAGILATTILQL